MAHPRKRPIILDASNVAYKYAEDMGLVAESDKRFCARGILVVMAHFIKMGHKPLAVIQESRANGTNTESALPEDTELIRKICDSRDQNGLRKQDLVIVSRGTQREGDDEWAISQANQVGGLLLSGDLFRSQLQKRPGWKETIDEKGLSFTFSGRDKVRLCQFPHQAMECDNKNADFNKMADEQLSATDIDEALNTIYSLLSGGNVVSDACAAGISRTLSETSMEGRQKKQKQNKQAKGPQPQQQLARGQANQTRGPHPQPQQLARGQANQAKGPHPQPQQLARGQANQAKGPHIQPQQLAKGQANPAKGPHPQPQQQAKAQAAAQPQNKGKKSKQGNLTCIVILEQESNVLLWNKYEGVMKTEKGDLVRGNWVQYDPAQKKFTKTPVGSLNVSLQRKNLEVSGKALCLADMAVSHCGLWNDMLGFIECKSAAAAKQDGNILQVVNFKAHLIPQFFSNPEKFINNQDGNIPCSDSVWLVTETTECSEMTFCFSQDIGMTVGRLDKSGCFGIGNDRKCSFLNDKLKNQVLALGPHGSPCTVVTVNHNVVIAVNNRDCKWHCVCGDAFVAYVQKPSGMLFVWNKDIGMFTCPPGYIPPNIVAVGDWCHAKVLMAKEDKCAPVSTILSLFKLPRKRQEIVSGVGIMLGTTRTVKQDASSFLARFIYSPELGVIKIMEDQLMNYFDIPPLSIVQFKAKLRSLEPKPNMSLALNKSGFLHTPWLLTSAEKLSLELEDFIETTNCIGMVASGTVVMSGKFKVIRAPNGHVFRFGPRNCDLDAFEQFNAGDNCVILYNVSCLGLQTLFVQTANMYNLTQPADIDLISF